jgi:hypothetical protein
VSTTTTHDEKKPSHGIAPREAEYFPRQLGLAKHSPLFWVENKDRFLRQLLIRDIQGMSKGRRLCVFFCSPYFKASLSQDDVGRLYEIVNTDDGGPFDLLLETQGGETDATEGLIKMLQEVNRDFRVIVPSRAKSNGTLICLAASKIIMGPTSELGPIEPLLRGHPVSALRAKGGAPPLLQKLADDAYQQTEALAKKYLAEGMMKGMTDKIPGTAKKLCSRSQYFSHGSVIDHSEARELHLDVEFLPATSEIWKRYWLLHAMYSWDSSVRRLGKYFEGHTLSLSVGSDLPTQRNELNLGEDKND